MANGSPEDGRCRSLEPAVVIFYNKEWYRLGTKKELSNELSVITGIDIKVLSDGIDPGTFSIAK